MHLRSFSYGTSYGVSELPQEVLNLFTPLVANPNRHLEYASEIVTAGLQGRINFNEEFNLSAYEATIRKNQRLLKEGERKKKVYIDFSNDDYDEISSTGGIRADCIQASCIKEIQDAFEDVILDEELAYAVSTIKSLNSEFICDYGTDLIFALKRAVEGIPQAVAELKRVCKDFSIVADLVEVVLSSSHSVNVLFAD